jgi:diaminohydroxyphosphoribosylaminopyrimidine deaminase/5-amino-6-(5-phosphoribosylamino)uracil reductase
VILDSAARLPIASKLVQSAQATPVWVAVTDRAPRDRVRALVEQGCTVLAFPGDGPVPIVALLQTLSQKGVTNLLVEGGGTVLGSFFDVGQVDAVDVYVAPVVEGGEPRFVPARGRGVPTMAEALRLTRPRVSQVGDDVRIEGTLARDWWIQARLDDRD